MNSKFIQVSVFLLAACSSGFAQSNPAEANRPDYSARFFFRTYSPGLSLNSQVGYAQSLWGDTTTPWHGFIRPYVTGVISPSTMEGKGGIELFPVSILGIDLRRTFSQRFTKAINQNCDVVQCFGALNFTELSLQSYFGAGDFYASFRWTRTFFDAVEDRLRPVYEHAASVLLNPGGDNGDSVLAIVGMNLGDGTSTGVLFQATDYHTSGNRQDAQYLFVKSDGARFGYENFEATVGVGRFFSSRNIAEVSAITMITYTGSRAIGFGR